MVAITRVKETIKDQKTKVAKLHHTEPESKHESHGQKGHSTTEKYTHSFVALQLEPFLANFLNKKKPRKNNPQS